MSKIILLGDTHLGIKNGSAIFSRRMALFFKFMFDYMLLNGIKHITQFGDLFDHRKYMNFIAFDAAKGFFFEELKNHNFTMDVLIGNHDIPYRNSLKANSPSLLLKEYESNITLFEKPTTVQYDKLKVDIIPWICTENQEECSEFISKSTSDLCFGHFEIAGFQMYKGSVCEHGLDKNIFKKYNHVYSGHFHHISTDDNITYLGSPYHLTWADYGDERGFFVLDTETAEIEFVRNPYDNFHKIVYDDKKLTETDILKFNYNAYNDTYVKVIIVNKTNLFLYDKFVEGMDASGATYSVIQESKFTGIDLDDTEITNVEAETIHDTFKRVSEQYASTTDQTKLYNLLLDLYTTAESQ